MATPTLTQADIELLNEIDTQAKMVGHLVEKLETRARTQGSVDGRWVNIARTDLQKGFMSLQRSVERPDGF